MKRTKILGLIALFAILFVACGQSNRSNRQSNLAELREDLVEVIQTIDEAIAARDISDFKSRADDAISKLDNRIDDYLDEMDNADRRVNQSVRSQVIDLKQKKVEVEFKLALLDQDDYDGDAMYHDGRVISDDDRDRTRTTTDGRVDRRQDGVEVGVDDRRRTTADGREVEVGVNDRRVTTDRDRTTTAPGTGYGTAPGTTDERGYAQDRTVVGDRDRDRDIVYGPQLIDEIKEDLRSLRNDVEQFMQASLE
jgi:hypothetical protein